MKINSKFLLIVLIGLIPFATALEAQQKNSSLLTGYAEASYYGLNDNIFLKNWLILGPVKIVSDGKIPDQERQKEWFEKDDLKSVMVKPNKPLPDFKAGESEYSWKFIKNDDATIDLISLLGTHSYVIGYALAEINMNEPAKVLAGVGSDDGIKIYLNGALIHKNWIMRGTKTDDDVVLLDLKKGSNQLLIKVQNGEGGWSFAIRKLGKDVLTNLLIESAGRGNFDNVKMLVENGADVNGVNEIGLSACQHAEIRGRDKIQNYLKEKGAITNAAFPAFDKLVDNMFKNAQKGNVPGVSILVSQDGKIIYENAFGYADVGNNVPVSVNTKFRIGSITKQFTASAILKLQEEGKINVQDKLSKYIPDFPRGNEVTIRHLLTHTSGIHSYTNRPSFMNYLTLPVTPKALIDTIKTFSYDFNPGEKYQYNNSGFFILGYLVEQITGKSFAQYLQETFFKPLRMNNTGIYETNALLENEAYGYAIENGTVKKALNWDMSWAGGAGALYSTVKDLYLWNEAVFNGKVLSEASLKEAFTPLVLNNGENFDYGYGWALQSIRDYKFISHGGGLHGFVSYLEHQPDKKVTVAVLCNSTPPPDGINPSENAQLIAEYLLGKDMAKQTSYETDTTVDVNTLKSYVGRYNYGQGSVMIVTLEDKNLYAQLTGQPKFPIFPASKEEFYWKVVEAKVKFVKDDLGNVTHARHSQGGRQFDVKKIPDETPVAIDPTIFDKYAGRYDIGNNTPITISKEGDKMYVQGPGLPKYELLPASEKEYFLREMNVRLTFELNNGNKAETITVNLDGTILSAKKISE